MNPTLIPDALFFCLQFFIPVLFFIKIFKVRVWIFDTDILINATGFTLLIASLFLITTLLLHAIAVHFSGVEYEQYALMNRFWGSVWTFFGFGVSKIIFPQTMWFKKVRTSVYGLYIWWLLYFTFNEGFMLLLVNNIRGGILPASWAVFTPNVSPLDYLIRVVIFLVVIKIIYSLLIIRERRFAEAEINND